VAAVRVDGADDVDGVEDAGEVAEDGEQDADPELHLQDPKGGEASGEGADRAKDGEGGRGRD
jgi:hypothetical protein